MAADFGAYFEGSIDMLIQLGTIFTIPVGNTQHTVAIGAADAQFADRALLIGLKVPVIGLIGGDTQIARVEHIFIKDLLMQQ